MRVLPPSGIFTPASLDADLLLFAGGSGITPVMSITRTALAEGSGRIVLFYANRDEQSVIFARELSELSEQYPERLQVVHWLESVQGLPTQEQMKAFAADRLEWDAFVCGPAPFMKMTVAALKELEFPRARRHQEKFVSLGGNPFGDLHDIELAENEITTAETDEDDAAADAAEASRGPVKVEVELDGEEYTFDDWDPRTKLLEFLESKGVKAPYSCREGECSACAIRLLQGEVRMLHNDVLDDDDLEDGIRLGCQSLPLTDTVKVSYSCLRFRGAAAGISVRRVLLMTASPGAGPTDGAAQRLTSTRSGIPTPRIRFSSQVRVRPSCTIDAFRLTLPM